jgi:hypothetical protein
MRRYLLASTAMLAVATPAAAETIATRVTAPVRTSTVKAGAPDSITITSAGSVVVTSGTAVTVDSNHSVTNQGAVTIGNANGAVGIAALAGTSGDIVNSGTITIDEPYTPTDSDNDGDLDGPFALGSNRFGIRTAGAHTGKVVNTGTITVEGNDSAGIWLGGPLTGAFTHDGKTTVLGDNAIGVQAQDITGNVRLAGTVTATGKDAIGARFSGDVRGAMVVQGAITSTGYRYTTAPASTAKLDADDLLQGGSALVIEGDVTGGIVLAVPPKDNNANNADEDGDGIEDAKEGAAKVVSYGAAPAMVIGATGRDLTIGPVTETATRFGLQIDGAVNGIGLYSGVDANGLVIGGRGGAVTIANGVGITGTVSAVSNGGSATALRFGAGATTPEIRNDGTVEAKGGASATAKTTAIEIDAGASVGTIRNSGAIKATASGENGSATAIIDRSGNTILVENSGAISATGASSSSGRNVAIDLSANTTGVTVKQTQVGSGFTAPAIEGNIRLGSGNDLLDVADGTFKGAAFFGSGNNTYALSGDAVHTGFAFFGAGSDTMSLAGSSVFSGTADFGGGADTLTIGDSARFSGGLANSANLAVNVTGGTLDISKPASIASLTVGAGGTLAVTLDKAAGSGTAYDVSGTASFASGAKLAVRLADVSNAEGSYVVVDAGSLQGASGIAVNTTAIPFLFKASLASNAGPNRIVVDVAKRTSQELGLNRSQGAAYNAVFAAIGEDDDIEKIFLGISDGDQFRHAVRQMLPDHAGGAFEGVSLGTRAFARQVGDPPSPVYSSGGLDVIVSAAAWTSDKDEGATAVYDLGGFGFSGAGEIDTGIGSFGLAATWLWNEYDQGSDLNRVLSDTYELAAYWRGKWGGLTAFGRGSIGMVDFRGRRTFTGQAGSKAVERHVISEWNGTMMSASGGLSYEGGGSHFFFRPSVSFDYLKLDEDGYTDHGGEGLDLEVEDRKSDEFAVNGGLTLGIDFTGTRRRDDNWFRVETEGGWREVVGGSLGATTAKFEDGTPFTLEPEQVDSGWYARLRAMGGSSMFEMGGELGAEDRHGGTALSLRGTLKMGF